jgi:hypothetical protein
VASATAKTIGPLMPLLKSPIKPGRVIDFNEQMMRYFDPTLRRGIVKVTPLPGDGWETGPISG